MADTLKNRKIYMCATAQPNDLLLSDYVALTWVQIKHVGTVGETGTKDNMVTYDQLDSDVLPKGKGISNAGDPTVEVSRSPTDAGQILARSAGGTHVIYAFKIQDDDAPVGYNPTTYYNRALVGGPTRPNGRQENFSLEVFTLACVQREIVVDPAPQSAPVLIAGAGPAIWCADSAPDVSNATLLYARHGDYTNGPITFTYQWQRDAAGNGTFSNIAGATASSYDAVAGDLSNCIRVVETATNAAGNVSTNSMSTKATVA